MTRTRLLIIVGLFGSLPPLGPVSAVRADGCPAGWDCVCNTNTPYATSGDPWGVVDNGSAENGFTGGVANDWTAAYQTFESNPTYTDSTLRATAGTHSQRIDIPEALWPLTNQRAGIRQHVYVVPGETYTVTCDVYMELDGGEAFSGENMIATVGLDPYGDVDIGEGSVDWSPAQGDKGAWRTLTMQTDAIFEVMTVYVAAWRKSNGFGNGRIWIDNIVLTGPVPTDPPSPPLEPPPDPDANVPATTGGELVSNGGFETGWSGGVAGGWSSWSTAGSGTWRQSTLVGPIGAGKYNFTEADTIVAMNPKTVLTMQMGDADYWATKPNMVDTVIVGRLFIDPYIGQYLSDPVFYGRKHADDCKVEQDNHPRIDCWQGFNEPGWGDDEWPKVVAFEKAFAERCHELGMKACVLNTSTGSPGNIWKMLEAHELLDIADYVGHHNYGGPNDQLMIDASPAIDNPCSFALRFRQYADMYNDRGWRIPPVIYTEATTYGGWHGAFSPEAIRDDLIAFGPFIHEDRWALGLTLFCAGGSGAWTDWNIQGQGDIAAACGVWNAANPSDAVDGLYSQQFGAGEIHPDTLSEMQNPNGNFTGGVVRQVTGLVTDNTYLLDLDFKFEFRGAQPQAKFYTGVDPTGQTGNPNASSIIWSADIIANESAVHEIWERTWRTFTATGSSASIWLKGEQTTANPAYRVSVDRVSVKQTVGGSSGPAIQLSTSQITTSTATGGNPPNDTFTVRNVGSDTLNYSISDNAAWLSETPASGTSTGETDTITVQYSAASLSAGIYNATITVSDPNATNNPQTIAVTLTVEDVTWSNETLVNAGFESGLSPWTTFGTTEGVINSGTHGVTAHGGTKMFGASAQWQVKNGGAYQQVSVCDGADVEATSWIYTRQSGGANWDVNCRIGIDPTGGTNAASANVVWTGWVNSQNAWTQIGLTGANGVTADGDTVTLFLEHWHKWALSFNLTLFDDVTLTATGGSGGGPEIPTITLSPTSLSPTTNEGGSPAAGSFTVQNTGEGTLNYSISDNVSWLSVSPTSGTSTGEQDTITVNYSTASLSPGNYNATITVSDANASNNPQTVAVNLTVIALPAIALSPTSLTPTTNQGSSPAAQSFTVQNTGGGTLNYSITDNVSWLSVTPTSGTGTGEQDTITVNYSTASLSPGNYNATITVSDAAASNNPQTVAVTLTVNASAITVAEDFQTMPSWSSTYNAGWGSAASWSIVGGGQAGNALQATRSSGGSSARVKVYTISANTNYTISIYMRAGSSGSTYWTESAYRLGSYTAQDFDQNAGAWTLVKKFANDGTNGNGDTWVQYSKTFNSGGNTQISVGVKAGSTGSYPTTRWDTLRIEP